MALRQFHDMAHDDEQLYDMCKGMPEDWEPPEYPDGLQFSIPKAVLAAAGGEDGAPDDRMRFSLMGEVTSVLCGREDSRVELRVTQFAGEDGKFVDLSDDDDAMPWMAPSICLRGAQLEKLGLEANCERGDMLHVIGTARLESLSSDEFGGDHARLQIVEMTVEDESSESREG